jgi:hypothetical protein
LLDFPDGLGAFFGVAAEEIVCVVDPGQLIIAWLRIEKHQPTIVAPHHPVVGSRKKVIKPGPTANMARFGWMSFLGCMVHASYGL